MTRPSDDLTIDELLRDPVTRAVMKADGVDAPAFEAMLRSLVPLAGYAAQRRQVANSPCLGSARILRSQVCEAL